MTVRTFAFASLLLIGFPLCASAGQANYSADDLINYYLSNAQGPTRGICVGTTEECEASMTNKVKPFDLQINFEKNSANLTESAKDNLVAASKAMLDPRLKDAKFAIDGFTDASGTEEYNFDLSERRAQAVVAFLAELGVDTTKLIAKGFGETRPLAEDPFDPLNRRVETRLIME